MNHSPNASPCVLTTRPSEAILSAKLRKHHEAREGPGKKRNRAENKKKNCNNKSCWENYGVPVCSALLFVRWPMLSRSSVNATTERGREDEANVHKNH